MRLSTGLRWMFGREYNLPLGDAVDGATNGQFLRDAADARQYAYGLYQAFVGDASTIQDELQIGGYMFADDEIRLMLALDSEV